MLFLLPTLVLTSMGRTPCCKKLDLKRGKWTSEEDEKLINYIKANGDHGSWRSLPTNAGLLRCGKSCRLRWINYLSDDVKRGNFTEDEEEFIVKLHNTLGNKWSLIASHLPGRTDNEIKNCWNTHLRRTIYRFKSSSESILTSVDMIKVAKTSKRRSGRVSRAVAKKYNKNTHPHFTTKTKNSEKISINEVNKQTATKEVDAQEGDLDTLRDGFVPESSNAYCLVTSCDLLSLDMVGPWEGVNEGLLMHRKEYEEGGAINCGKEVVISEGTDKVPMDMDSVTANEEKNYGAWSSNLSAGNLFGCSSPIVSYFNNDEFCWDLDGAMNELGFWSEEEDMLIWS